MVDQRISELTDGGSFAAGDEFVVNRGGANRRVQVSANDPKLDIYATTAQANAGTINNALMNPVLTRNAIEAVSITSAGFATTAQATAATSDGTIMAPSTTGKAIQNIAFTAATSFASTAQAEAGTDAATVMNPVLTKNAIEALGNQGTFTSANAATTAQATAGTSDGTFVTPVNAVKITQDNSINSVGEDTAPQLGGHLAFNGRGFTVPATAASSQLQPRDICIVTTSGVALANASAQITTQGMMVMAITTVAASASANFMVQGVYTTSALTRGDILYLATSNGGFTTSRPSATAEQVRIIGYSLSPTELYFDPDKTWLENA